MGAAPPGDAHPQAPLVGVVETHQHGVDAREVRVLVALGQAAEHADEQSAHRQLAPPRPEGQGRFEGADGRGEIGLVEHRFDATERVCHRRAAPSRATQLASGGTPRWATRSPRRWVQVTPAASMKAASPIVSAMATR